MIPYGRQDVTQADIDAVVAVLASDFLTQGPQVPAFERAISAHCGARYAVAVNSATSALHVACMALGLGPGDWLWTSPITFVASANCALYCGAQVDFVDIDPRTYNMSATRLAEKLEAAERDGRLPKVVVPVHLTGQPCEMAEIHALSQRYGFRIIEDASHAIGAHYRGEAVGNCRYSDITVYSFHPVKIVTTGEGGAATTNDAELANTMARLRSHGITREPQQMTRAPDGPWYYEQIELGYNYRMCDLQAALGISQMQRLHEYVTLRHEIARIYNERLADLPLDLPWQHPDGNTSYHLYVARLKMGQCRISQRELFEGLRAKGVGVNLHYIPVPLQPYYAQMGSGMKNLPEAARYYAEALSLPIFPRLERKELEHTLAALEALLAE
jgi:UDP-4-amino-4,6-dideoxy-N-acetyl-beta-L-altrosamine transaminase